MRFSPSRYVGLICSTPSMSLCSEMRSRTSASLSATATEGSFAFRGHVAAKRRDGSEAGIVGTDGNDILWRQPKWCQGEAGCEPADDASESRRVNHLP